MNYYHIHKFRSPSDIWSVGQKLTDRETNPYYESLRSNCVSFINTDNGTKNDYDHFFRIANNYPSETVEQVRYLRQKARQNVEREIIFEDVRKKEFPNLPSRIKCLYISESLTEATSWLDNVIGTSKGSFEGEYSYQLVELMPSEHVKVFRTNDSALWGCLGLDKMQLATRARDYWSANGEGQTEWLAEGDFQVVRIIDSKINAHILSM